MMNLFHFFFLNFSAVFRPPPPTLFSLLIPSRLVLFFWFRTVVLLERDTLGDDCKKLFL